MKIKPNRNPGGVVVELGPEEHEIPGVGTEPIAAPAFKLKRILVPIDFTPCSKKALQYAVAFGKQFDAELCLIYVGQSPYFVPELGPMDMTAVQSRACEDAAGKLAAISKDEVGSDVPAQVFVRQGHAPTEIVKAAGELNADLIIISTHGYTGLKHAWFGSLTEDLVRHARCPILVVREIEHEFVT